MKRAPKELLDAVKEAAACCTDPQPMRALHEILFEWGPSDLGPYQTDDALEILRKDVAEWKKRATEAEARAVRVERLAALACEHNLDAREPKI